MSIYAVLDKLRDLDRATEWLSESAGSGAAALLADASQDNAAEWLAASAVWSRLDVRLGDLFMRHMERRRREMDLKNE